MHRIALVIAFLAGLIVPTFAQKAEIEAVNAKWVEFFNKGDFAGIASLYTDDATAFPPGSGMVKGSSTAAMERHGVVKSAIRRRQPLDVKPLGLLRGEIGTFSLEDQGSDAAGNHRQVCRCGRRS
jgi:hypothetical protein